MSDEPLAAEPAVSRRIGPRLRWVVALLVLGVPLTAWMISLAGGRGGAPGLDRRDEFGSVVARNDEARRHYQLAVEAFEARNLPSMENHFRDAVAIDPEFAMAYFRSSESRGSGGSTTRYVSSRIGPTSLFRGKRRFTST